MLKVKKLHKDAVLPTVGHEGDLGFDLYALEETVLTKHEPIKVSTGIAAYFASDVSPRQMYGLLIRDRSSVAHMGITVSGGVIDAGYRGEIKVMLTSQHTLTVVPGSKIAQMIPMLSLTASGVQEVEEFAELTSRGADGFGSTGR